MRATRPRRARFQLRWESELAPEQLWERLWDLSRHSSAVPLTQVRSCDDKPLRQGSRFVARTALGPLHLDDEMLVTQWRPPHGATVTKTGRLLTGTIHATVLPAGRGSVILWEQEFGARGVPDGIAALLRHPVGAGYQRILRRIIE